MSLIPYDEKHFELVRSAVTVEKVAEYFGETVKGRIDRYELPRLGALNFYLHKALGGGSTRSLRRDIHGKAMSSVFLEMLVDVPDDFVRPSLPA